MKALLFILLLAASVFAQKSGSDLGINASYDKFLDITTVELTESLPPDRPGYVLFSVAASVKGENIEHTPPHSTTIFIHSFTDDWYFLKTDTTLRVIQDGQRYQLGRMKRVHAQVATSGVHELLALEVSFAAVQRLSRGSKIEIRVGRYEVELKPSAIENIKAWVKWFPKKLR